ncbi:hypothetical protein LINPERPRIM_LOCUS12772 [Linum perenne]
MVLLRSGVSPEARSSAFLKLVVIIIFCYSLVS